MYNEKKHKLYRIRNQCNLLVEFKYRTVRVLLRRGIFLSLCVPKFITALRNSQANGISIHSFSRFFDYVATISSDFGGGGHAGARLAIFGIRFLSPSRCLGAFACGCLGWSHLLRQGGWGTLISLLSLHLFGFNNLLFGSFSIVLAFGWERGYMMIGFVNQGELYPRFTELVSKMGVDDFLGQESIQRYKLDVHSSDRERVNSTLSTLSKPGQILCREGIDSLTLLSLVLLHVFFFLLYWVDWIVPLSHSWANHPSVQWEAIPKNQSTCILGQTNMHHSLSMQPIHFLSRSTTWSIKGSMRLG